MSARWSRSLAMVTAWEPASPTESRSDGFVGVGPLDVARGSGTGAGPASKDFTASTPRRICFHTSSRTMTRRSPGSAISRIPRPQEDRQVRAMPTASSPSGFEPGQGQGLDGGGPVHVDGGVVVEQAGQGAGDELAEGVAQQPGLVEEVPGGGVPALVRSGARVGLLSRCHRAGMVVSASVVLPWRTRSGRRRAALTTFSSTGPNGTGLAPTRWEPTRPRMRVSQRPNTTAARLRACCAVRLFQSVAQRSERQGVDPGGQAGADRERGPRRRTGTAARTRPWGRPGSGCGTRSPSSAG